MATRIQLRRDTAENWTNSNPTLAEGEIGFETNTGLFKIGRSNTAWTALDYAQVAGPTGSEGAVGPVGAVGEQGAPGLNGADGANGENGINGLSAYEIWLSLGNSGSEQDFIDSLAGEDGVAGVDGVDGVDGLNGANGAAGAAGLGYKVRAQIDDSVAAGSGFSSWIFEEYSAYQNGNRIRIFSEGGDFQEGTISDLSNGLNFQLNIESSNGTLGSGYYPVTIVGDPGLTGGEGIQGPGYLATGLISNNLNVSTIGIDGNSSQVVNFTGDKIAYQAGDRVKVAQVSNPSNYIGGVVNDVIYGTPIVSGIAPYLTYSFPTSVNVVIDSKGGSGTWTANSTQLSISLAGGADGTFATAQTVSSDIITETYTISTSDAGKLLVFNASLTNNTVTIPSNSSDAIPVGTRFDILQKTENGVFIQGGVGVNLYSTPGTWLRTQYSGASLIKIGTNDWSLVGDLTDVAPGA